MFDLPIYLMIVFGGLTLLLRTANGSWSELNLNVEVWRLLSVELRASDSDEE